MLKWQSNKGGIFVGMLHIKTADTIPQFHFICKQLIFY